MQLRALSSRRPSDGGFTLIELVVTVAIVGFIVVGLTNVVISYALTTNATAARLTETHDVQFTSAYWSRDVASIGIRSTTYCPDLVTAGCSNGPIHSFPLKQSVNVTPACTLPSGTTIVTLAWSSYVVTDPSNPSTITVTYLTQPSGTRKKLVRVHCSGSHVDTSTVLADNLIADPVIGCPTPADSCNGTGSNVPTVMTMKLTANDPSGHNANYSATLSGERRTT